MLLPFAAQAQSLLIGWEVYRITRDPLFLGIIGFVEALPALAIALFAGHFVDRSHPLTFYKRTFALILANALFLFAISSSWVGIADDRKLILLYAGAFVAGVCRGFRMPTVTALIPQLVPKTALHISAAWNVSSFSISSALGPLSAGFLYAYLGPSSPFALNVILIALAIVFAWQIKLKPSAKPPREPAAFFDEITAGLRYVLSHRLLMPALALDMFAVLFGGVVALLPVFAHEILEVGPAGLGILGAATSLGALSGGLLLIRFPVRKHSGRILLGAVAGFGLCMLGFGLSTNFWLSVCLLAVGGVFDSVSMVIRGTIVQLSAPDHMRGRVGAVNSVFIGTSNQLGEFESGVAAKLFGTSPSVVLGSIVTLVIVLVTALKAPALRNMEIADLQKD